MMTGMEQGLRYIEREIRFMVKDQFGNPTYAKYADRVVEDACGIPNFCTTVLSSERPLTAILRAVRGSRGDVIVKFFNVSLHDARIEMVMVLAEAIKLRSHRNKASREAHEYLMKLYKKAIKRTIRIITGSKQKDSYKSMYRGLRHYAGMDDFDLDDEEEEDDYFDIDEFGDSDFAESCLSAYRDGKLPPEPTIAYSGSPKLQGNDEILMEIARIESKLGRHLTDSELDQLICGDDDDDEPEIGNQMSTKGLNSDKMVDELAELVCAKVFEKLGQKISFKEEKEDSGYESLDDFLDKQNNKPVEEVVKTTEKPGIPLNRDYRLDELVGIHNHMKNDMPLNIEEKEVEEDDSSDDESDSLPPNEQLGGNDDSETTISINDSDDIDELFIAKPVSDTEGNNLLLIGDIINDFSNKLLRENDVLSQRLNNYFKELDTAQLTDIQILVFPATNKLLKLTISLRVNGDDEIIDYMHISTVILVHIKNLAKMLDIPENLIHTDIRISRSHDKFNKYPTEDIYRALSALVVYTYRKYGMDFNFRLNYNPENGDVNVYITDKKNKRIDKAFDKFYDNELIGENIINEVLAAFNISNNVSFKIIEDINEYLLDTKRLMSNEYLDSSDIDKYATYVCEEIGEYFNTVGEYLDKEIPTDVTYSHSDIFINKESLVLDIKYTVNTSEQIAPAAITGLEDQIDFLNEYQFGIEDIFVEISNGVIVQPHIEYNVDDDESVTATEGNNVNTSKTSNFGI